MGKGEGGVSYCSKHLYRSNSREIGTLGGNWHFRWGDFFQVGLKNSLYKKIVNTNLKQKKKIPFVISPISHFWSPKLINFCICILIFHDIHQSSQRYKVPPEKTQSYLKSQFPPEITLLKSQQNFQSHLKSNFLFTPILNIYFKKFSR